METPIKHIRLPLSVDEKVKAFGKENNYATYTQAVVKALEKFFEDHPVNQGE